MLKFVIHAFTGCVLRFFVCYPLVLLITLRKGISPYRDTPFLEYKRTWDKCITLNPFHPIGNTDVNGIAF